jgi:hypothetical protein
MSFDFTTIILILFMLMSLQPLVPARTLLTTGAPSQTGGRVAGVLPGVLAAGVRGSG